MAITLDVELRKDLGRGASRRLRREEKIPAIIVAKGQETVSVTLDEKKLIQACTKPDFFTENVTLNLDGNQVVVKPTAMQRHPVTSRVIHVDFQRV